MYKRPSSPPSVTTVTTVATEERLNMSHRQRRRQQPQDWQQRRPQQQHHLHDCDLHHHHHHQQQHQKQQQGQQWSGGWGITSQANPSSVTTERFLQPRRLDPSSLGAWHHPHIQLQRHCGVNSGTRLGSETQILPVLRTVNGQTTQRPIVQLVGDRGPARASSVNSQH